MEYRKTMAAGVGLVLLVLVVIIGLIVFRRSDSGALTPVNPTGFPEGESPTTNVVPATPVASDLGSLSTDIAEAQRDDQDLDGLTDSEEKTYRTDQNSSDSDNDGLFDRDEVAVYKTDPLKTDSDADGRSDGFEVKHDTNPTGPGPLVIPTPSQPVTAPSTTR